MSSGCDEVPGRPHDVGAHEWPRRRTADRARPSTLAAVALPDGPLRARVVLRLDREEAAGRRRSGSSNGRRRRARRTRSRPSPRPRWPTRRSVAIEPPAQSRPASARTSPGWSGGSPRQLAQAVDPLDDVRVRREQRGRALLELLDRVREVQVLRGAVRDLEHLPVARRSWPAPARGRAGCGSARPTSRRRGTPAGGSPRAGRAAPTIGAMIARTIATTNRIAASPPPPRSRSPPPRRPPPQNVKRRKKSARRAMEPTSTATSSENRMSSCGRGPARGPIDALELLAIELLEEAGGDGDRGVLRVTPGGEGVRRRVVDDVHLRHRQARGERDLADDVHAAAAPPPA